MMRLTALVLLLVLGCQVSASELIARVDRTQLSLGETVELTLETQGTRLFGKPDLGPLHELFEVASPRQMNRLSSIDGEALARTSWQVTLQPRQTGYVVVPPLRLGDWQSQPITLHVQDPGLPDASYKLAPIFIDASLDRDRVYVQAQVILTLRIYHSVSLYDDSTLSPLQLTEALVEQLGTWRTYEKDINGIRHGVIEIRYALFPQQSGQLTIPSQLFSATTAVAYSGDDLPFGSRFGRATQVKSPSIPLQVLPKPAEYPADTPWLPATSVALAEAWSPEPDQARVGESLTRSLLLKAEGLSSAQLPPLPSASGPGLRSYPDQPNLANEATASGLTGSREQSEALIATQAGEIKLPAIKVTWWNTQEDRLEHTQLAARTLQVAENPERLQRPTQPQTTQPVVIEGPPVWPWQLSSLVLAITTLLGFGLWLRARRRPAVLRALQAGPTPRSLLDDLKRACQANDSQATRQALDAWARQQPETLADMAARFVPLSDALDGLNGTLYSEAGQRWQGDALWQAIQSLPPLPTASQEQESSALPPLYPR